MSAARREKESKEARVQALLAEKQLDALLLRRVSSFAWATAGAPSFVNVATDFGEASLLYTPDGTHLITSVIEAPRLERELGLVEQGWTLQVHPWGESMGLLERLTKGLRLGSDAPSLHPTAVDLSREVSRLRAALGPEEGERFRELGRRSAAALKRTSEVLRPGQTEWEIAALVSSELLSRELWPVVVQVAADERVFSYRHALPTERRFERYLLVSFCARWQGLVASISRLLHRGPLPEDLRRKERAVAEVDATFLASAVPGARMADVFAKAAAAYAHVGFPEEWRHHHQGGAAGYEPREFLVTPDSRDIVLAGQAYAFNPSIAGTKSEDTILVGEHGPEILTAIEGWPLERVDVLGETFERPKILEMR